MTRPYKHRDLNNPVEQIYWNIGQVSDKINVSIEVIRTWCKWFDINPKRNKKGDRRFTYQELCRLQVVHILLHVEGYTMRGVQRELGITRKNRC